MAMLTAPVNNIIPFSNVDGPGNRTSVFFQGCTFDCMFCHNPETINLCRGCGACVDKCPAGALSIGSPEEAVPGSQCIRWDHKKCVKCDTCIRVCPHDASPRVRNMTVDEVVGEIRRTSPYISGITVSGGECTLRNEFLIELFTAVRNLKKEPALTCLIDSNGSFDFEKDPRVLEVSEGVMLDVKAAREEWSRSLIRTEAASGRDLVLKNLDYLLEAGKLQEVRTVLFPGLDRENEETVRYVSGRIGSACDYKLIRYRPFGVREKYQKVLGEDETPVEYAARFVDLAHALGASRAYVL